jgi:hypothetical protein
MTAANDIGTVLEAYLGNAPPVHVRCWDGSSWRTRTPHSGSPTPRGMFFVATKTYVTA